MIRLKTIYTFLITCLLLISCSQPKNNLIGKDNSELMPYTIYNENESHSEPKNCIIEADYSKLFPDTINGETEKESHRKFQEFYEELLSNTINRAIPNVEIVNLQGDKMNLRDILIGETILISSDSHCGWGLEGLTNDFPNAIKELGKDSLSFNVICLLKRGKSDLNNPEFKKTFDELKLIYRTVFIIEETKARKINLSANPARFYINREKVVTHIGGGVSSIEGSLLNEIKENTGANKG